MRRVRVVMAAALAAALLGATTPAAPSPVAEEQLLTAPTPHEGADFGKSVVVDGSTMVIGDPGDPTLGESAGRVHVYERTDGNWQHAAELVGAGTDKRDRFGWTVDLQGDRLVVGAPGWATGFGTPIGAVYVFERNNHGAWEQTARLLAVTTSTSDRVELGTDVALDGDRILAGGPQASTTAQVRTGAAFVFELSDGKWTKTHELLGDRYYDAMGHQVALSGDTAVVGSFHGHVNGVRTGKVHVWTLGAPGEATRQVVTAPDRAENDYFGYSLQLDGDLLVVGAPLDDDSGLAGSGSVYRYIRSVDGNFEYAGKLTSPSPAANDRFGLHVELGDRALHVGSPMANEDLGHIDIFLRDPNWEHLTGYASPRAVTGDRFGATFGLDGDDLLVGMPQSSMAAPSAGALVVLALDLNRAPTGADDQYTFTLTDMIGPAGLAATVDAPGVLANDHDPDGDPLTTALLEGPSQGEVKLSPDGSFTYRPANPLVESASFTYVVSDGHLQSPPVTVQLEVTSPLP